MREISDFLAELGIEDSLSLFVDNDIDMEVLGELSETELKEIGLSLGHRKKVLKALRSQPEPVAAPARREQRQKPTTNPKGVSDAERRQLTVVFCDMVGSTALAAKLDPEEMFEVISGYQRCCTDVLEHYNGHVAKFLGDGVLAYFGYPTAREDDAERAVAASLELISAVNRLEFPGVGRLEARVGIDTGLVVAGELLGGGHAEEDAIVGDTPNLAARLQSLARPSSVVLSANTRRLLAGLFEYNDLGDHDLKGFQEPMRAFEVVGFGSAETRFDAKKSMGVTPLVGRSQELELLSDRWRMARQGEGQAVGLVGEGGVGKSRLVSELRDRLSSSPHRVLSYICAEFHQDTAFFPIVRQIERSAGISRQDPDQLKFEKAARLLESAGIDEPPAVATFAWHLDLNIPEVEPARQLPPEERKSLFFSTLIELMERMAARIPLLIMFEDLHWVDPSTTELLNHVIDRVQNRRIMLLATFRPEFQAIWDRQPHVTHLQLNRLGRNLGTVLVDRVTGGKTIPPEVLDDILDRTDGVPLFVEEFTKNLIEGGILKLHDNEYRLEAPLEGSAIPATLQDSLAARLDRLSSAKEIAQWASALGRNFTDQLLMTVVPLEANEIRTGIESLLSSEIIYRRGMAPRETYEFKHALLQEAAYAGMIKVRRVQLHRRIAVVIGEHFPDIVRRHPETLARHMEAAGMLEEAITPLISAGDLAAERFARKESRHHYNAALALAQKLPGSEQAAKARIQITLKRATVAIGREQIEQDLADLREARTIAQNLGQSLRQAQIAYWIGRSHYVSGDFEQAAMRATEALSMSEDIEQSEKLAANAVNLLARIECLRGRPKEAIAHASRNIAQMRALNDHIETAAMHGVLAFGQALAGEFDDAVAVASDGAALADGTSHLPTQAACHFFNGLVLGWRGSLPEANASFANSIGYAESAGDLFRLYLIHGWRGEVKLLGGDFEGARADLLSCQDRARELGSDYHLPAFQAFLASISARDGEEDDAIARLDECIQEAGANHQDWAKAIALRIRAEILSTRGDTATALQSIDDAITILERDGVITDLYRTILLKAQIIAMTEGIHAGNPWFGHALSLAEKMNIESLLAETRSAWAAAKLDTDHSEAHLEEEKSA